MVIEPNHRGAGPLKMQADAVGDPSLPRSAPPPHERLAGQRNRSFISTQFRPLQLGILARGVGRVKNVTSAAARLIAL